MTGDEKVWFWFHEEAARFKKWIPRESVHKETITIISFDGHVVRYYYGRDRRDVSWLYIYHFLDTYKKIEYA